MTNSYRVLVPLALLLLAAGCGSPPPEKAEIPAPAPPAAPALAAVPGTAGLNWADDVSPADFVAASTAPGGPLLLDVRSQEEFDGGHVAGAVLIPHGELAGRLAELDEARGRGVVVTCESGRRAGLAREVLVQAGFERVVLLDGSMQRWRAEGRPVVMGPPAP